MRYHFGLFVYVMGAFGCLDFFRGQGWEYLAMGIALSVVGSIILDGERRKPVDNL